MPHFRCTSNCVEKDQYYEHVISSHSKHFTIQSALFPTWMVVCERHPQLDDQSELSSDQDLIKKGNIQVNIPWVSSKVFFYSFPFITSPFHWLLPPAALLITPLSPSLSLSLSPSLPLSPYLSLPLSLSPSLSLSLSPSLLLFLLSSRSCLLRLDLYARSGDKH